MASLLATYKWITEYKEKTLSLPTTSAPFIELDEIQNSEIILDENCQFNSTLPFAASDCFSASIVDVKQLVNNEGTVDVKTVYELTLKICNKVFSYLPGDTIGILPENQENVVNEIINRNADLKVKCTVPVKLKLSEAATKQKKMPKIPMHLPRNTTNILKILIEAIDLSAIPKKAFLCSLARHCVSEPIEKLFLEILASREGSAIYVAEILQSQKSFLDIFSELKSMKFNFDTISILFEHLPRLMPRPYSIASSPLTVKTLPQYDRNGTILKIIFSVNSPPGLTTRLLEQKIFKYQVDHTLTLDLGEEAINLYLRQSNRFRLTDEDYTRPLILIAIGTGIAPFIGFLEHRQESKKKFNRDPGFTWLIFGCRLKAKQLCANKLQEFQKLGILNKFDETFSRDCGSQEKYVQDVIYYNGESFAQRFFQREDERAAKIFICGNKKMAQDVRSAIELVLIKYTTKCDVEVKAIIDDMIKNSRYIEDIWT